MTPPMTPREKVARTLFDRGRQVHDAATWEEAGDEMRDWLLGHADAILTALASGSGDHADHFGGVTDMVDHAELAKLVDDPAMDFGGFGRSSVSALLAENAALRERLETARIARAAHNRQHGEAERKLAEAVEVIEFYAATHTWRSSTVYMCGHSGKTRADSDGGKRARTFLSKEDHR